MDMIEIVIGLIAVALIAFIVFAFMNENEDRKRFMSECSQDRKQYECEALWRSGNSDVVPMFIPIPMGR